MSGNKGIVIVWCVAFALCIALCPAAQSLTIYVATNGNDAWSGTLDAPNATASDGPVATIARARDLLRAMRAAGTLTEPVQVLLRGGMYSMTEPVVFGPEDSGTEQAPVTYAAYPGETPVLHGGRAITGWRQEGDFWVADVADGWEFGALWVNGVRRQPARTPNATHPAGDEPTDDDFFYTASAALEIGADGKEVKSATKFRYRAGDLQSWPSLKDAVFVVFHSWATSLHRPKSIDTAGRYIEFTGPARWPFTRWRNDQWYFVEHLFEALDRPGEWFLNRKEDKVYYIPAPNEDLATADVIAPVARQLIRLDGQPAEGRFVEYLHFSGLKLHYTEYPIAPEGHSDGQAAYSVPAAFEATGARHCTIDRCELAHLGTYAVWFRTGCQDNRLTHTEAFDLGAGGVRIGEGGSPASDNEAVLRNVVENCFLHDGGRIFRSAVGVWIGRSSYNTIARNEICDFRYSGMSIGWSWGYAESSAHHNVVEYNHIHHCGHGQLSDMGAIYTLGMSPGTVLRNNLMHDILSNPKVSGGWGIYFDEGSTGILAENNIVYNTLTGTLHQHYGKENRVVNNILAFSHREQLIRSREEEHVSFILDRNIIYFNNGRLLGSTWKNGNFTLDNNCYWDTSSDELDFAGRTFAEWQAEGFDTHSIVADPLFVNAEAGDFRLKPESPALQLGFNPIDTTGIGLYGEPEWVDKPNRIPRKPFSPPPAPAPLVISDGFEDTPIEATAASAATLGEEDTATIRVTNETAAQGERSLKFTDAPGLQHSFNPHLVYAPHFKKGTAVGSFALRAGPGAVFYHEWRDSNSPYRVGPSLRLDATGKLGIPGKPALTIPPDTWVQVEIECPLGKAANGTWNLTLTFPGQPPQRYDNLPCGDTNFRRLDWYGFVSNATEEVVFYIDNVNLATQ
ncbi:MAG: right-handed parallel beta-helix repeat-containing protein [Nitrospiraceae bacterium]|nr:right-handed parallel beta-helix repeat-containing protein [Nitrospiraceae bacterium]